jgi:hypothetical protein
VHKGFQTFRIPVYGILCGDSSGGSVFEFFLFDGTTNPYSFKYGLGPDNSQCFQLPDPGGITNTNPARPFIHALRPICEIIFDLLLSGYVSSLKAYHNYSVDKSNKSTIECQSKKTGGWEEPTSAAVHAWQGFRNAEMKRQTQLIDEANLIVEEAMKSLKYRYGILKHCI